MRYGYAVDMCARINILVVAYVYIYSHGATRVNGWLKTV